MSILLAFLKRLLNHSVDLGCNRVVEVDYHIRNTWTFALDKTAVNISRIVQELDLGKQHVVVVVAEDNCL